MSAVRGTSPLVSVIVPTYADRAPRLQSALASIWAQEGLGTRFDVEPIVIDDASLGPTEEVSRRFPGTRYVRLETNRGPAAARNAGLRVATGKYVAFLDDDDLWLPRRLSVQVPVLEQAQGVEVVYSQFTHVYGDGTSNVAPAPKGPSGWIFEAIFKGYIVHVPTVLIPRVAFDKVGDFDERIWYGDDTDMWLRLSLQFPFRYVPGIVAVYVESSREWTVAHSDERIRSWLIRRDKILALVHGAPNEVDIKRFVLSGTWAHVVSILWLSRRLDEMRRSLLQALAEFPMLDSDTWYSSQMKEQALRLALASDSHEATMSLCADIKRTGGGGGLRRRLRMRAFLAEVWASVALHFASGRRRNDGRARLAAARAILDNPLVALSRPGLLRLVSRP